MATTVSSSPINVRSHSTFAKVRPSGLIQHSAPSADHLFVNNIRFLSMAAIVAMHSFGWIAIVAGIDPSNWLLGCMLQLCKFGTIGFFLISGFLMGESLRRRKSLDYLARRIKTICLPWLTWFALYGSLVLINRAVTGRISALFSGPDYHAIFSLLQDLLFTTSYWFVPNLLLAICVLLLCRRHLTSLWLGAALLLPCLFYGIDAYTQWIPGQTHTKALLGFVFYLWLGAWAARNFDKVKRFAERIPWPVILATSILLGMAVLLEGVALARMGNPDFLNTLRISNQAYSVAVALAIFKARKTLYPQALNARSSTFGIYLSHTVILGLALSLAKRGTPPGILVRASHLGTVAVLVMLLCAWIVAYGCSLALTRALVSQPHLCWLVGVRRPTPHTTPQQHENERNAHRCL